jgi:hypothetical protein
VLLPQKGTVLVLMKIGSTPLTIDCPYQRMAISDANKGMA